MFKKYIFVGQDNLKDCGVACLLNMIKRHGGNISVEELRNLTKTDKDGTSIYNLIDAAVKIGFDAKAYKVENINLVKTPFIAHVTINKAYKHFVIVESFSSEKVIVNDPAFGIKKYKFNDFLDIWNNIAIKLKPITKIMNKEYKNVMIKIILDLFNNHKIKLIVISLLSIINVVIGVLLAAYFKILLDYIPKSYLFIEGVVFCFLILLLFKILIEYWHNFLLIKISKLIDQHLLISVFKHIIKLPYNYFYSRHSGDIIERINNIIYVRDVISKVIITLLVDFLMFIGASAVIFSINRTLFIGLFLLLIIQFIINCLSRNGLMQLIRIKLSESSVLSQNIVEGLKGIDTIKSLNIENIFINKIYNQNNRVSDVNYKLDFKANGINVIRSGTIDFTLLITLFLGIYMIKNNQMNLGQLFLYYSVSFYYIDSLKNLLNLELSVNIALASIKRINELLNLPVEKLESTGTKIEGKIRFENVSFAYDESNLIFDSLNFEVKNTEKIMLTGKSGIGKSTILKLIFGYYKISSGSIFIDDLSIYDYNLGDIRTNIVYVSQNEMLFTDSIYNNITLGTEIDQNEFIYICKVTKVDEIFLQRNVDCNMLLEENGSNISGGEKQRIILARALLKKASIYMFDESMSELNKQLEIDITNNILNYLKDKTVIMISHSNNTNDLYEREINL